MLSDSETIDEDLEALLYAQVYYGKGEEAQVPELTEEDININLEKQVESASGETYSNRHNYKQKRYFENNLVREDKEKENKDIFATKTITGNLNEDNLPSEASDLKSTPEFESVQEGQEKFTLDKLIPTQVVQGSESTDAQQHQFIEISTSSPSSKSSQKNSTQVVTTVPLLRSPTEPNQPQLLNNITINQYLYPSNFLERLRSSTENQPLSKSCRRDFSSLKKGEITEQEFFNKLKRRLKIQKRQQKQIRQAYFKKQKSISQSEVICLSDSGSSDIEVVEVTNISKDSNKMSSTMKDTVELCLEGNQNDIADDDEIIYIAPPPIPVIHIDTESDTEGSDKDNEVSDKDTVNRETKNKEAPSQNCFDSQLEFDDTLDDFLQPKNTPDNFNFSLHGSDFQNTEFLKPANPTDVYETESSTSTSDFNRDSSRQFCNSVKTIVFNEVEFPNQDIFNDTNLESFGEFITPKRGDKEENIETKSNSKDNAYHSKDNKRVNTRTSSESSSESEYEGTNAHQNLPELTPMVCSMTSPKKNKKNKKKTVESLKKKTGSIEETEPKTRSTKKKSKEKYSDKNDGILDVEQTADAEKPSKKIKRKSCGAVVEDEETPRKKIKKKKNKSGSKSVVDDEELLSTIICNSPSKSLKGKKLVEDEIDISSAPDESSKRKSKKKKKNTKNENRNIETEQEELLPVQEKGETTENNGKRKEKKKKGGDSTLGTPSKDGKLIEDEMEVLEQRNDADARDEGNVLADNGKRKSRKRKQKESSESRIVVETSTSINDENKLSKNTDKNKESLNKSSEDQDILVLEENDISEDSRSTKKNKRKKHASSDKRNSLEECNISYDENKNSKDSENKSQELEEKKIEEIAIGEEKSKENIDEVSQSQVDDDIIIIEKAIPVHTIESSESDQEEDILTFDGVGNDLELANISTNKENLAEVIDNRNFDVDYVQSKMSDDPEKWKISSSDRYNLNIAKKGPRCKKCRQFGHVAIYCPNKPSLPVCTLCGKSGHYEPRCPNKVCFTCGKPGNYSTIYCYMCVKQRKDRCTLCSITGHKTDYCPDLWRRYFLTTTEGPLKIPKKNCPTLKPRNKQWCSGCASSGHLEFECNTYKWIREYPASSPNVFKYQDVYEKGRKEEPRGATKSKWGSTGTDSRRPTQLEIFVAEKLNIPVRTSPRKFFSVKTNVRNIIQRLESPERSQKENVSEDVVINTEENQQISEKIAESLNSTAEIQIENQQSIENASTVQTATANQPDFLPESNSELPGPNPIQNVQLEECPITQQNVKSNTNQVQPISKQPYPAQSSRVQSRKRGPRHARINPVSMLRRPTGYTHYQSVLNPYSLLGAPSAIPSRGLFNPVPNEVLTRQLANLASTVADFPDPRNFIQNNYNCPNQNESNFYQSEQYPIQIPPNPTPLFDLFSNAYQDFSGPIIPEAYHDGEPQNMYGNRDFLDRPYTITRDPMEEDRSRLHFQPVETHLRARDFFVRGDPIENSESPSDFRPAEGNFREREAYDRDLYRGEIDWRGSENLRSEPGHNLISSETPPKQTNDYVPRGELARSDITQTQNSSDFIYPYTDEEIKIPTFDLKNVDISTERKFTSSPREFLNLFLRKELKKLNSFQRPDMKNLKKKLNIIDQLKKIEVKTNSVKNQIYCLYKRINMFLFGVLKICEGNRNLNYLQYFVSKPIYRISGKKRRALLQAYGYIFGGEHPDFNYRRYLNNMTVTNKN